jgi:hypothetical protein
MWVFTSSGFVSAVRKHDRPDVITVRSRDRKSLESLVALTQQEVKASPFGDYPYRLFVDPEIFAGWVAEQAKLIDYDNFKNTIPKSERRRHEAYMTIWASMLRYQEEVQRGES